MTHLSKEFNLPTLQFFLQLIKDEEEDFPVSLTILHMKLLFMSFWKHSGMIRLNLVFDFSPLATNLYKVSNWSSIPSRS